VVAGRAASEEHRSTAAGGRNPSHREVFGAVIRGRGRANQGSGGVDQAAAYRLRLVAAAGTTGAREQGEKRMRSSVGSNRPSDRTDQVEPC
jgi:hypothetical protein